MAFLREHEWNGQADKGQDKGIDIDFKSEIVIIQEVTVVPTFAPMMTAIESASDISPALTKLTTITVDADEDCINAVIKIPVKSPAKRFLVIADRMLRMRSPATFCSPSLIIFIP